MLSGCVCACAIKAMHSRAVSRLRGRLFEFERTSSLQSTQRETAVFLIRALFIMTNTPKTSRLNILKMLIRPPTRPPATVTLSASSKYSGAAVYYTVWFHFPLNIHIQFSTDLWHVSEKWLTLVCAWLHLCVVIDFKIERRPGAVMETSSFKNGEQHAVVLLMSWFLAWILWIRQESLKM